LVARKSFARDSAARSSKLRAFCDCAIAIAVCKDRGLQRLLGRCGIGWVAPQKDLGADAVDFRFVPALFGALQLGERIVQAPEPGSGLA